MKFVIVGITGLLLAGTIFILVSYSPRSKITLSPVPLNTTPTTVPVATGAAILQTYNDPSGFTFQYPKNVVIKQVAKPDDQIYASLELSLPNTTQTVTIKVENSSLNTIDQWFSPGKKSSIFGDVTIGKLADLDSREFTSNNVQTTLALDQGALFTIATNAGIKDPLYETYGHIKSTFAFVQPTQNAQDNSSGSGSGGGSDIIDEGEEVVQ